MSEHIYKLENKDEGIIDVVIRPPAELLADYSYSAGFTPNQITIFRTLLSFVGVYFLYKGDFGLWIFLYLLNYFLDCVDGIQARKYKQVSKLGDTLDHLSDAVVFISAMAVIIIKYKLFSNKIATFLTLLVLFLFFAQTGNQQDKCDNSNGKKDTALENFTVMNKLGIPVCVTKNFSAAFIAIWIAYLPVVLVQFQK